MGGQHQKATWLLEPGIQMGLIFFLQATLLFYVPVSTENGCLMHPHTSGHLASGEHTL